ncbi:hypothetical protein GOP47_0011788 [Adiantum capillus-veneris]|uniref:NADH:ubiquinone oxidoreductase intermediate-associated protein 30 domain-containing protein n=1 Tax=Adiantum capillus-veneris TaxID=13818 RepID=A0A9D4UTZ2_ADICA|nr:hypothetical protein GOP47_0011788 [Adiantum capillus-veneris]
MFRALVRATTDAARRAVAWKFEELQPPKELSLFRFSSQDDLRKWIVHSDSDYGGLSSAGLELGGDTNKTAVFSGTLSEELREPGIGRIARSGFSGMRTIQGCSSFDLDSFDTLALRVKGDGRCYVSTIRTQSWWGTFEDANTWQSMIFAPKDEWFEVMIPLSRYLPTMKGKIIELKSEMNQSRVCGMGLAVSVNGCLEGAVVGPGDFRLELDWIKALPMDSVHGSYGMRESSKTLLKHYHGNISLDEFLLRSRLSFITLSHNGCVCEVPCPT